MPEHSFPHAYSTKTLLHTQPQSSSVRVISKPLSKMITVLGIFQAPYFEGKSAKDALGECFTCHKERRRVSNSIHSLSVYFQQLPVEKIDCAQSTHTESSPLHPRHPTTETLLLLLCQNISASPFFVRTDVYPLPIQFTVHPN